MLRKLLVPFIVSFLFLSPVMGQTLSGTYTIPGLVNSVQVNNLTDLAGILPSSNVNGTVIFEFTSAYTGVETFPVIFPFFSPGKVIIRPAASVVSPLITSGSPSSSALIDLNTVKNLTFDGRPGGIGNTSQWKFQNTAVSGSYPVFRFTNTAQYNTLEYLTILASGSSSSSTILFGTTSNNSGNSYDTVHYCNIGNYAGYPYNPVLSNGSAGGPNANNSILNNNIYNFQCYNTTTPYYGGVNITATGNGSSWNISGNSIYSTINPLSLGSYTYHAIYFNAGSSSTGNIISGNYIGGQAPLCGGAPWGVPAYGANGYADFDGIYVAAGGTTQVTNNTIQNITMASKYGSSTFRGINIISGGANVTGNVIGSSTAPHSILSGLYGTMMGIQNQSSGTVIISNNTVANLTANGSSYVSGTSSTTTGVTIGIYGYNNGLLGPCTISHNHVYNFSRIDNYNNNLYFPVNSGGGISSQQNIYQQNIIAGICVQTTGSASQTISGNMIYNLYDSITGGTSRIYLNGIVVNAAGGTHTLAGNFVYGLWTLDNFGGSSYYAGLNGIYLPTSTAGTYLVYNNMVNLGYRPNGTSVQNALISGIWDNTNLNNTNLKLRVYHNSVYIGGTNTNAFSNNLNSYAFRRMLIYGSSVYDSLVIKNNIFVNNRSTSSGTGKNYGIYLNASTDVESDYNDIYGTGTGFLFGDIGGTDYSTLLAYKLSNPAYDANSLSADPLFNSPNSGTFDLHIGSTSPCDQTGTTSLTTTYDYDSIIRANATPVDMGATVTCAAGGNTPTITLATTVDTICPGGSIYYTTYGNNWGTGGWIVNFYVNNVLKQSGLATDFTATNLNNGDSVVATITTNNGCTPLSATSNSRYVIARYIAPAPQVEVLANNLIACQGDWASFFAASVTYGGSSPQYVFFVNGNIIQTSLSPTYYDTTLNNNDSVWMMLISNDACIANNSVLSDTFHVTRYPVVNASVTLSASSTNFCVGTPVTFTAHGVNQGPGAHYYFSINDAVVQADTVPMFTTADLHNSDSVTVMMESVFPCSGNPHLTSEIVVTVNDYVTPTILLGLSDTLLCNGSTTVTAGVVTTNEGPSPTYNFFVNGLVVQSGSQPFYFGNNWHNNDSVWVELISNASCLTTNNIVSNKSYLHVSSVITPSVSLSPSSSAVCQGEPVTFTATPSGGGATPSYNFYLNGSSIQNGSLSTYTNSGLSSTDSVYVVLTSSASCANPSTAHSNAVKVIINHPVLTQQSQAICPGDAYLFHNTPISSAGTYFDTLTAITGCDSVIQLALTMRNIDSTLRGAFICQGHTYDFNGTTVSQPGTYRDILTGAAGCDSIIILQLAVGSAVTSNITDSICEGDSYSFNGQNFTAAGTYTDTLSAIGGCDSIVTLQLTTHAKPIPVIIKTGDDTLTTITFGTYQWLLNGGAVNGATGQTYIATVDGSYSVFVTDAFGCSDTSAPVNVVHLGIVETEVMNLAVYPNPTSGNLVIAFSGMNEELKNMKLMDISGRVLNEQTITANKLQLNMRGYSSGTYLIDVSAGGIHSIKKIELIKE